MIIYDLNLAYAKQENNLTQHGRCVCLTSLSFVVFFYERVRVEVNYIEMYVISWVLLCILVPTKGLQLIIIVVFVLFSCLKPDGVVDAVVQSLDSEYFVTALGRNPFW